MQVIPYKLEKLYVGLLPLAEASQKLEVLQCLVLSESCRAVSVITSHSPAGFPYNAAVFIPAVLETSRPIGNFSKPCCEFHISVLLQSSSLF